MTRGRVPEQPRHLLQAGLVLLAMLLPTQIFGPLVQDARAIPAFARKYGLACTGCHEAWPTLNDFGRAFRDNGYQMLLGEDSPTKLSPGYWPISIRITPHYEFVSVDHQSTDQGVRTLSTGGI